MKIFIAGARAISAINDDVKRKLLAIARDGYGVLIGDAAGADRIVQNFYAGIKYQNVTVYASNGIARNNLGNWKVEKVMVNGNKQGFDYYKQKDIAMAYAADYGFMLWNGESKGTLNNMISLSQQGKTCLVYFEPQKSFFTIKNTGDLLDLLTHCPASTSSIYRKLANIKPLAERSGYKQLSIF